MYFVPSRLAAARTVPSCARRQADVSEGDVVEQRDGYFAALKLFLVFGPLLGLAALELITLRRDKLRGAEGRPPVPVRGARAGARGAAPSDPGP